MSLDWGAAPGLPRYVRAAMRALDLRAPDYEGLGALGEREWDSLLGWLDRQQMTLLFGHACVGRLPAEIEAGIGRRLEANRVRLARLEHDYREIAAALSEAGVPHVVLKGFTHGPPYVPAAELRPQYDLDLLVRSERLEHAQQVLVGLGFEPAEERGTPPADHTPPLIRRTGWRWKGDYFDTEIPTVVELHHRLWDPRTEGFGALDLEAMVSRAGGIPPALDPDDRAVYAAAHALRHLLRGSLKLLHVYEIGRFSDALVERWNLEVEQRLPVAIVCGLAREWFGCRVSADVANAIDALPGPVQRWFERYAASPLTREFRPNKDELWLQLELVQGFTGRLRVARRRLAPFVLPGPLEGQFDRAKPPVGERFSRTLRYGGYVGLRAAFHTKSLCRTLIEAGRWLTVRSA